MLLRTTLNDKIVIKINGTTIYLSDSVIFLGITFDTGLKFDQLVKIFCQYVDKDVQVVSRIANFLDIDKVKYLTISFCC